MATTYVSMANLTKYDGLLKQYIVDGWYDKTEIDDFISIIEDREANFIDKTVNDLVNYYTKSETYTKTEVNTLVSAIPKFAIVVVDELPTEDISPTTIYLLRSGEEEHNLFTEYIYVDNAWEMLGAQKIDLSDYYTMEEVDYLLPKNISDLNDDVGVMTINNIGDFAVTGVKGESELVYQRGDVTLNKRMVGLSLVENKSPRQIIAQMTGDDVTSALGFMPLNSSEYVQSSSTQNGYVPASNGVANKVWGTNANGEVGWQDNSGGGGTAGVTGVKGDAEVDYRTGNVILSKANIGLGNVENKSSATILSELTQSDVLTKIGVLPIANGGTGNANGYIQTGVKEGTSIGSGSTIEGKNNQVTGKQSHAEGYGNRVTSNYAHAEGYVTVASGSTSHAEGTGTTAGYANQHVSGKYNNNKNTTLLEIGNGESSSAKSNAFEVHSDGYISTGEEAKIKFGKNANDEYGYYKYGEDTLTPFGSGGSGGDVTGVKGNAESSYRTGNVNITPANIGAVATSDKGVANGVAELDNSGKVPSSQLPSYVDDVEEYASLSNFPATGESGKIYVALDTNKTYRWTGSTYVELSEGVVLGETSSTAYRGDRGKIAYDDSQTNKAAIGTLANLETTVKTDLVSAINEIAQGGGGSSTYAGLTDVIVNNVSDGDISVYDAEEQKWVNSTALTDLIATVGEVNDAFNSLFNDDAESGDIEGLFSV